MAGNKEKNIPKHLPCYNSGKQDFSAGLTDLLTLIHVFVDHVAPVKCIIAIEDFISCKPIITQTGNTRPNKIMSLDITLFWKIFNV